MSSWDPGNTEMTKIQFLFLRNSDRDECANGYIYIYICIYSIYCTEERDCN